MIYTIKNDEIEVKISSKGAELQSITDIEKTEYLWQGDPTYWTDRAINIFPYVARLTEGSYYLDGTKYQMETHGFLASLELQVEQQTNYNVELCLYSDDTTKKQYPYDFTYRILYECKQHMLQITYIVENHDKKAMYMGIGGHPGFMVPLESGLAFDDYYLEFQEESEPIRVSFSDTCFVLNEDERYYLQEKKKIMLTHDLFDKDAIILKNMPKQVTLRSNKGRKGICVKYPDMQYLGIWHMPHTDAPYVCIEPWSSLPSRQGIIEDLATQPNLIRMPAGESYQNTWSITMLN